jgi:beta-xylosidase
VVEAVILWNEPNNVAHWCLELDPGWRRFGELIKTAAPAVRAESPHLTCILGGMSPIDPSFLSNLRNQGVLDVVDVVAVHGFPLDWTPWSINEWPKHLEDLRAITDLPIWVTEVGVSTYPQLAEWVHPTTYPNLTSEERQSAALRETAEALTGRTPRIHWYSLYDLPRSRSVMTRYREAQSPSIRHYFMGLLGEDGQPKLAARQFADYTPEFGICQWFHFEDPRLEDAVRWLRALGVKRVRTGLSWSDDSRPNVLRWFDRQMQALDEFDVTLTFCFTPEAKGLVPHHTSPPVRAEEFAEFCGRMVARYAT